MGFLETFFIAIGLAMDAFAVSVCKGLSMFKMNWRKAFTIAIYFGFFQMVMPLLGFLLGMSFSEWIEAIDHWIAFILLSFIGGKMIKESFDYACNSNKYRCISNWNYICVFRCEELYVFICINWNYYLYNFFVGSDNWKQIWNKIWE